jgi:hypothetical protein
VARLAAAQAVLSAAPAAGKKGAKAS